MSRRQLTVFETCVTPLRQDPTTAVYCCFSSIQNEETRHERLLQKKAIQRNRRTRKLSKEEKIERICQTLPHNSIDRFHLPRLQEKLVSIFL
ncbi:hypothetical protein COOONC_17985 [Cooperia oncophora]